MSSLTQRLSKTNPKLLVLVFAILWGLVYFNLQGIAVLIVELLPIPAESQFGQALTFFIYDAPKVLLLLSAVVFLMGLINTWFTPERTRSLLATRRLGSANILAALLGVVTPFCSCSAVPLFIGFVQAGVPLGVTFSFLIAAPMVNEIALTLLFGLFGWKIALTYLVLGLTVAIVGGWVLGRMKLEHLLESWVRDITAREVTPDEEHIHFDDRILIAKTSMLDILRKVWIYVLIGIGVGAFIHGYVPEEFFASIMEADNILSIPMAVLLGIPLYSGAAAMIPIVEALLSKGASLGAALAFMMSVVALSLPELIILRKVLTLRLIVIFASIVTGGILSVGFLFNLLS